MPTKSPATTEPLPTQKQKPAQQPTPEPAPSREAVFDIFRRWGYLQASLDPLGQFLPPEPFPTPAPDGPAAQEARRYLLRHHRRRVHAHPLAERRAWIQERLEEHIAPSRPPPRPHRPDAHPHRPHPRRPLRAGHPAALPRHQALLARRPHRPHPLPRPALHHRRRKRRQHAPSSP